eukprot:2300828-Pyramimonas_sp.AAC.1
MSKRNVIADAPISTPISSNLARDNPARSAGLPLVAAPHWSERPALRISRGPQRALDRGLT